jgi:hypothetical protein
MGAQILTAGVHANRKPGWVCQRHLPHEAPIAGAKVEQNLVVARQTAYSSTRRIGPEA